jgi:hypothetical protein
MTSSQLAPPESELFDSSSDNVMLEMKQVTEIGPDEASKVFSYLEEKQELDRSAKSTNDSVKKTDHTIGPTAGPVTKSGPVMTEQSQREREHDSVQSIEGQVMVPKPEKVPYIAQIRSESQDQEHLDRSVIVYDNENSVFYLILILPTMTIITLSLLGCDFGEPIL